MTEDDFQEKYFIDINIELTLKVDEDKKEIVVDKINKLIHKMIQKENAIHMNVGINLISESDIVFSLVNRFNPEEEN
jgi:uncharacterized OsmC-like protein